MIYPNCVKFSNVALFADDTKIYMKFIESKCKVLSVAFRAEPLVYSYILNDIIVERCEDVNGLGVKIGNKLN